MDYTREEADAKLLPAVYLTIRDLKEHHDLDVNFRQLCIDQLKVFFSTYRSIALLLSNYEDDALLGADALSLGRERIEKVFAVSLLCEDPEQWAMVYVKDDWRRMFARYLLEEAERRDLPRYQEFLQQAYASVERVRNLLGIPENVRDLVKYRFFNPQDPPGGPPKRLAGIKKPEEFPTPGTVLKVLKKSSSPKVYFLERWYKEYRFFCDFSHCGMGKLQMTHLYDPSSGYSNEAKDDFYYKEVQNAAAVSYVATASACTELVEVLGSSDVDRKA